MLKKEFRIRKPRDYNNIYRYGKKIPGRYIIVYIKENYGKINRYGVVASKKVGNAVVRNKAKRQIREILKKYSARLGDSSDIVVVVRRSISKGGFSDIERDYVSALKKAGLC
ncbi:MAG: ribonuclease P protein component [Syntrophomonadaceae bacterium]|jgi:ribonuclease P protein component